MRQTYRNGLLVDVPTQCAGPLIQSLTCGEAQPQPDPIFFTEIDDGLPPEARDGEGMMAGSGMDGGAEVITYGIQPPSENAIVMLGIIADIGSDDGYEVVAPTNVDGVGTFTIPAGAFSRIGFSLTTLGADATDDFIVVGAITSPNPEDAPIPLGMGPDGWTINGDPAADGYVSPDKQVANAVLNFPLGINKASFQVTVRRKSDNKVVAVVNADVERQSNAWTTDPDAVLPAILTDGGTGQWALCEEDRIDANNAVLAQGPVNGETMYAGFKVFYDENDEGTNIGNILAAQDGDIVFLAEGTPSPRYVSLSFGSLSINLEQDVYLGVEIEVNGGSNIFKYINKDDGWVTGGEDVPVHSNCNDSSAVPLYSNFEVMIPAAAVDDVVVTYTITDAATDEEIHVGTFIVRLGPGA